MCFVHGHDLRDQSRSVHFEVGWLIGAGFLYLAGLLACGWFFERILRSSPTPVRLFPALRAYLVSHLGKYVPGKAMVVVVARGHGGSLWRAGVDRGDRDVL